MGSGIAVRAKGEILPSRLDRFYKVEWRPERMCSPVGPHQMTSLVRDCYGESPPAVLVFEGHAFEVAALELLAGNFRCLLIKTGEARPVKHLSAF